MELIAIINKNRKKLIYSIFIFLAAALIVTFVQPLKYRAQAQVLVVQEFEESVDPYSASKLNEYLGGLLAKIVSSESFFNQTIKSGFGIDTGYFSGSKKKQLKQWNKTVEAKSLYESGIIVLSVYHPNKDQAEKIAQAAIYTLKTTNSFYHSVPKVDVRIIDSPSVSFLPAKPNILFNIIIGLLFGFVSGLLFVYYNEQNKTALEKIKEKIL
ncbi:hypothetical protein COT99_03300 [Candidatus Falkowbacteria bacterium CG10_big_fil_rev_8_21_14_0_10_43_10]|uniref:Polysaccharide chain length determinant N-terminal domain-containing protein n=1 Tax=Candidatus Falkowbacteria bacterium CG10_big_fil_rev_8_21_14_0_10_43_10 TaxID=1974567 RepID=A0A2H0V1L9_9BACT|nr:MAG: hypothetical protein COT99_03300 [Candidatus Falkowbacteria bacterium CG10_big_fil_rev_8_21_14_0_10_43_10]